jgi:hypothetical protein
VVVRHELNVCHSSMEAQVNLFAQACAALDIPASHVEAESILQAARENVSSIPLCQQVMLSHGVSHGVKVHAAMVYRDAVARCWNMLSLEEKVSTRDWPLPFMLEKCVSHNAADAALAAQLTGTIAVVFKRAWLELQDTQKTALLEQLWQLMQSPDASVQQTVAKLCTNIIQEFGLLSATRVTSMGVSAEFHRQVAQSFQEYGLKEMLQIATQAVVSHSEAPLNFALLRPLMDVITEVMGWDFNNSKRTDAASGETPMSFTATTGSGATAHISRITPPASFGSVLIDAHGSIARGIVNIYLSSREAAVTDDAARECSRSCRLALLQLCALFGPAFTIHASASAHHAAMLMELVVGLLQHPLLGQLEALRARAHEDDVTPLVFTEAEDLGTAVCALLFNHNLSSLVPIMESTGLLNALASFTVMVVDHVDSVARSVNSASSGGHDTGVTAAVQDFISNGYAQISEAMDSLLSSWQAIVSELAGIAEKEMAVSGGIATAFSDVVTSQGNVYSSNREHETRVDDTVLSLLASARAMVAGIFERLVRARLNLATAIIRCDVDDDNPFEDQSALQDHLFCVAILGRFVPDQTCSLLNSLTTEAVGRLQSAVGCRHGSSDTEFAIASEELWWLVSYAGMFLADDHVGEAPMVPTPLNTLSRIAMKGVAGAVQRQEIASVDPVVHLITSILQLAAFEHERLVRASCEPERTQISPMLAARLLWFVGRTCATYLCPDLDLYRTIPLSLALSHAFGWDSGEIEEAMRAGNSAATSTGLLIVPTEPNVYHARMVTELVIQLTTTFLAVWGGTEPVVCEQAQLVFRTMCSLRGIARLVVHSPSFSILCEYWMKSISGDSDAISASVAAQEGTWAAPLHKIPLLPAALQQHVFCSLLTVTRAIGGESEFHLGAVNTSAGELESDTLISEIVNRWKSYYTSFLGSLQDRFQQVLASQAFQTHPTDPLVQRELERLVALHGSVLYADARVPEAWHSSVTVAALTLCPVIMDAYKASGAITMAVLDYLKQFVSADLFSLPVEYSAAAYKAIGQVFDLYGRYHGVSSTRLKEGSLQEQDAYEDILQLLSILEEVIKQEDLIFFADTQASADDISQAVGECVVHGLTYLMPMMSAALLQFPKLATAYTNVVSELVSRHASQVSQLDPSLFSSFVASLEFGLRNALPEIVRTSMEAVTALAQFHSTSVRHGHPGISAHLATDASIFPRFIIAVLAAVMGGSLTPRILLSPAADALLALIVADSSVFQSTVMQLIVEQPNADISARLSDEFQVLMTDKGLQLATDRTNQAIFRGNFEGFVDNVRGFTKIM